MPQTSDERIAKDSWANKKVTRKDGTVQLQLKGCPDTTCSRKVIQGEGNVASVFSYAPEGLHELKKQCTDSELIASAIAVAESTNSFATSEERENILVVNTKGKEREIVISGNGSKGLKLLMTWLKEEKMLDESKVMEDKIDGEVNMTVASQVQFLVGAV